MSAQDTYERLLPEIQSIKNEDIVKPNIPVEEKVVEGKKVLKLIEEDREALITSSIDVNYLDSLEERLEAYEIAEAKYIVLKDSAESLTDKLKVLQDKIFKIRKILLHNLSFALKEDSAAIAAIERISHGRSFNNKIFDIRPILELAYTHLEDLDKLTFNRTILDDAEMLYNETQEILSEISASPKNMSEVKDIRDKAYTYFNEALRKIKEHGQFVFWENEERLKLYKSSFNSQKRNKKGNNNKNDIELEPMEIED